MQALSLSLFAGSLPFAGAHRPIPNAGDLQAAQCQRKAGPQNLKMAEEGQPCHSTTVAAYATAAAASLAP